MSLRICLVTPSHVASNPRLVKEADALQAAGYHVHVVAHRYFRSLDAQDAAIYQAAHWQYTVVDSTHGVGPVFAKIQRRFYRSLFSRGYPLNFQRSARAYHSAIPALAAAAARVPADIYIGHCLAGLTAAALAARRTGARLGFDAEDFHSAETDFAENDPLEHAIISLLERTVLPDCKHFTAASPLIGQAYVDTYGIRPPVSILNVFPLDEAPPTPVERPAPTPDSPARVYWFSQTIGAGRGLEEIIPVLAALRTPVELHLRGFVTPEYKSILSHTALKAGLLRPIVFHGYAPMSEMVRLAADYDLALSLEPTLPLNRDLCLTNKVFTYLLAGVPQLLSPTRAHIALSGDLGIAARLIEPTHPNELAAKLDDWWDDNRSVQSARLHAWNLGQKYYNWNRLSRHFLAELERAIKHS
jgi:glycosyltransferase involved in cell wall biosynthesis